MIAACPSCSARYRIEPERLRADGVRLRCSRCESVFRVRPPVAQAAAVPVAAEVPIAAPVATVPIAAPVATVPIAAPVAKEPVAAPVAREQVAAPVAVVPVAAPVAPVAAAPAPAPVAASESAPTIAIPSPQPEVGAASRQAPSPNEPPGDSPNTDRTRMVLIADPEVESGKVTAHAVAGWGLTPILVHDGVEAMMSIQRMLPRVVVLDAALPKMFGFQVCEVLKRNESLRDIHVVLVGAIHNRDRYRRPPTELYGADGYLERHELADRLSGLLAEIGMPVVDSSNAAQSQLPSDPEPVAVPQPDPTREPTALQPETAALRPNTSRQPDTSLQPAAEPSPEIAQQPVAATELVAEPVPVAALPPVAVPEPLAAPESAIDEQDVAEPAPVLAAPSIAPPQPTAAPPAAPQPVAVPAPVAVPVVAAEPEPAVLASPPLPAESVQQPDAGSPQAPPAVVDPRVTDAERLARIVVSDIILYNPEKFDTGVRDGNVLEVMAADLAEGRSLFDGRVDASVRGRRDFLSERLVEVARERGMS